MTPRELSAISPGIEIPASVSDIVVPTDVVHLPVIVNQAVGSALFPPAHLRYRCQKMEVIKWLIPSSEENIICKLVIHLAYIHMHAHN